MLNNVSVLVAEDQPFIALDLALAVEDAGGKIVGPAASGEEALALLATAARAQDVNDAIQHPFRFSGNVVTTGQLYGHTGIAGRLPGQSYSIGLTPQMTLFGSFYTIRFRPRND